jgi:hypothetical protein
MPSAPIPPRQDKSSASFTFPPLIRQQRAGGEIRNDRRFYVSLIRLGQQAKSPFRAG